MGKTTFSCLSLLECLLVGIAGLCAADQSAHSKADAKIEPPREAVVKLMPTKGSDVHGAILLRQEGKTVRIKGKVEGLTPGKHGFHIHQFGDLRSADGKSAGGHYAPRGHQHGGPADSEHHAGDLGNIEANSEGVAQVDLTSKDFELHFVLGRAIVVHAKADDLKSQPSGDAGARVAIGVIGYAEIKQPTSAAKLKTGDQPSRTESVR